MYPGSQGKYCFVKQTGYQIYACMLWVFKSNVFFLSDRVFFLGGVLLFVFLFYFLAMQDLSFLTRD